MRNAGACERTSRRERKSTRRTLLFPAPTDTRQPMTDARSPLRESHNKDGGSTLYMELLPDRNDNSPKAASFPMLHRQPIALASRISLHVATTCSHLSTRMNLHHGGRAAGWSTNHPTPIGGRTASGHAHKWPSCRRPRRRTPQAPPRKRRGTAHLFHKRRKGKPMAGSTGQPPEVATRGRLGGPWQTRHEM